MMGFMVVLLDVFGENSCGPGFFGIRRSNEPFYEAVLLDVGRRRLKC
jgi:hypothetical protein